MNKEAPILVEHAEMINQAIVPRSDWTEDMAIVWWISNAVVHEIVGDGVDVSLISSSELYYVVFLEDAIFVNTQFCGISMCSEYLKNPNILVAHLFDGIRNFIICNDDDIDEIFVTFNVACKMFATIFQRKELFEWHFKPSEQTEESLQSNVNNIPPNNST